MIGVISKPHQVQVVEEFFELFKTPWEVYRPGQAYDVIIATADTIPQVSSKLTVIYGTATKDVDAYFGVVAGERQQRAVLTQPASVFPVYGGLLTFSEYGQGIPCITADSGIAGVRIGEPESIVIRLGYDLFDEVQLLLVAGQPVDQAFTPTLEIHIRMLRQWILEAGIPLIEIPPAPAGHSFAVCLTHDIDFVGIRNHRFDHSMWGFVYRATIGSVGRLFAGRLSVKNLLRNWAAVASLPLVYAGWKKDFWEPFEWYLEVEKSIPATYFLIPRKRYPGEKVPGRHAARRATGYDINDLTHQTKVLLHRGCEIGVHGIDAWHSADKGREELITTVAVAHDANPGIRMHWLLRDENTPSLLERAGYAYDSTFGYNETVGYRCGVSQVFRPIGATKLLELPLHIQDGALFYPQRLDLSPADAEKLCHVLIDNAGKFGGVLTLLWHDRSHAPERFWGGFYVRLLKTLTSLDAWFGTASQVVGWFRKRRKVHFEKVQTPDGERIRLRYEGREIDPPLRIRVYRPECRRVAEESSGEPTAEFVDIPWNGTSLDEDQFQIPSGFLAMFADLAPCPLS